MKIILGGVLSRHPLVPGSVWHRLHYLLGFLRLGHDVTYVEEVDPKWCVDARGQPCPFAHSANRELFRATLGRFGLLERACQVYNGGEATFGLERAELVARARDADLLLNMSGNIKTDLILGNVRRRVYEDHDPVYTQLWCAEYAKDLNFGAHQVFFTRGLNLGTPRSPIPDCGIRWHPVLPPVVPDYWPVREEGPRRRFTTIASWGGYGDLCFRGEWYRSKYAEFARFAALPREAGQEMEVVLKGYREGDERVRALCANGWLLGDPDRVADLDGYQDYLARSRGEISIAKHAYVQGYSGWFSERAAHYLVSGRPVLHQATGFEQHLPTGRGLLAFRTVPEAVAAVAEVNRDYARHCLAARELAEEYLDYRKVLPRLLEISTAG